jgi:gas vesicle protein
MRDIFYFLLGAVVGSIFALLFAPQSGEELRANIQTTAEKDWQNAQAQWHAEQKKLHTRLDQLQADLKGVKQQEAEPSEEAEEPAQVE